jgi:hypothetical protein
MDKQQLEKVKAFTKIFLIECPLREDNHENRVEVENGILLAFEKSGILSQTASVKEEKKLFTKVKAFAEMFVIKVPIEEDDPESSVAAANDILLEFEKSGILSQTASVKEEKKLFTKEQWEKVKAFAEMFLIENPQEEDDHESRVAVPKGILVAFERSGILSQTASVEEKKVKVKAFTEIFLIVCPLHEEDGRVGTANNILLAFEKSGILSQTASVKEEKELLTKFKAFKEIFVIVGGMWEKLSEEENTKK